MSRLPIEFRPAIGASCTRASFDGTKILSLCSRDPGVSERPDDGYGNLVACDVRDDIVPMFTPRDALDGVSTRSRYSTGYGVKMAWQIDAEVSTSRLGFLPFDFPKRPEINDGSLWHLAAIIGTSRSKVDFEPATAYPPHLFFCPNYQHVSEQWFPVEVDPDNATIGQLAFTEGRKTASRKFSARLVSRENYRLVLPQYVPSMDVFEIPDMLVTSMPAVIPQGGFFTTQLTLSQALPPQLGEMDALLVNLGNTLYGWKLWTIQKIEDPFTRLLLTVTATTTMSAAYAIPPSDPCDDVRGVLQSRHRMLQTYCVLPFSGDPPPIGQQSLTFARLIGEAGCPPGSAPGTAPPEPPLIQTTIERTIHFQHNLGEASHYVFPISAGGKSYPTLHANGATWANRDTWTAFHQKYLTSNPRYGFPPAERAACANVYAYQNSGGGVRGCSRSYLAFYTGFLGDIINGRPYTIDQIQMGFWLPFDEALYAASAADPYRPIEPPRSADDKNIYLVPATFTVPTDGEWPESLWTSDPPNRVDPAHVFRLLDFPATYSGDGALVHAMDLGVGTPLDLTPGTGFTKFILCSDDDFIGPQPTDDADLARNLISFDGFELVVRLTVNG